MDFHLTYLNEYLVRAHTRAGQQWFADADIPDPLERRDLYTNPALVQQVLDRRVRDGSTVGVPHTFIGPKPDGGERRFTYVDPYADLAIRLALRFVARRIEAATPDQVVHARVDRKNPNGPWQSVPWRQAQRQMRARAASERAKLRKLGGSVVHTDVASFYPSIDLDILTLILNSCGASVWEITPILDLLTQLKSFPNMSSGLPIGPEASAVLATAALLPVDRALRREGFGTYLRWSDDFTVFTAHAPFAAQEVIQSQLSLLGLTLNSGKTRVESIEQVPSHSASMTEPEPLDEKESNDDGNALYELIEAASGEDSKRTSYLLGGFRKRSDRRAIGVLEKFPWVTRVLPKQSGAYLTAVHGDLENTDREWIAERILATNSCSPLEQLRLGFVLARARALPADGARLFDRSISMDRRTHAPAADAFACAAAQSSENFRTRARRAGEYAIELSDLNAKRAHISVLQGGSMGQDSERILTEIVRRDRDMEPTAAWIRASK